MSDIIMVKDFPFSERGYQLLPLHGLLFPISSNVFCMHHPTDITVLTTAFVTPLVEHWLEREIGSTMRDRSDDPSHHERMLYPLF